MIAAIEKTVAEFGGIDICVNNASAISLTNSQGTDMKRFDLMMGINTRGTFMVSKYCIPHLKKADNPHILMLSPPLDMKQKWFEHSTRLHHGEVRHEHVRARPVGRTEIGRRRRQRAVAAHDDRDRRGRQSARRRRHDARQPHARDHGRRGPCHLRPNRRANSPGNFCIDDKVLYANGVRDFDHYRVDPSVP